MSLQADTPLQEQVLSITEVNLLAKNLLEDTLPALWLEGEISNLSMHGSGHWYLSLKDDESQLRAAMFKGRNQYLRFKPRNGQHVRVKGRISLYAPRGDYQFIIEQMEDAGVGALQKAFEALKAKLQAEGLFAPELKRTLPALPSCIGLVTSPTGAAVHDILTVLQRRCPLIPVIIYPSAVQGAEAPAQLVAAIRTANARAECDVLIVGRGGGSLEDLWAFNDETLARTIRASRLPIVSAVGHQVDFSIADFVADARAPTPSAAAEMLSPDQQEWLLALQGNERKLFQRMQRYLREQGQQLQQLQARLKHPGKRLEEHNQRLDELSLRLQRAVQRDLTGRQQQLTGLRDRLRLTSPQEKIRQQHLAVAQLQQRLQARMLQQLDSRRNTLATRVARLDALSPLATLGRGYSILKKADGSILRRASEVQPGDQVDAQLAHGFLRCAVVSAGDHQR